MGDGDQEIQGINPQEERRKNPPQETKITPQQAQLQEKEEETPGYIERYAKVFGKLGRERMEQGVGKDRGPDMNHMHYEAMALTDKDIDPGTGTLNRGAILEEAGDIANEIKNTGESVVIGMIDFNYFRDVNTQYGHLGGDKAIKILARGMRHSIRAKDKLGRYGGDEMLVVLRDISEEDAQKLIEERAFDAKNIIPGLTVTVGLTKMIPGDLEQSITNADDTAYVAKEDAHKNYSNEARTFSSLTEEEKDMLEKKRQEVELKRINPTLKMKNVA
ncbi:MAG TPA: GGDEF domain-containing protein [Patescibacteria group bacterium]|nr:GGDEF domain-containing protein [Patescibacteria group bacterium]